MEPIEQEICIDILFVAMTRPPTMWGVPYTAFLVEFMGTALIFLAAGNILFLLVALPIHGVLYLISAHDPGALPARFMWIVTLGKCRNRGFWGASSFAPMRVKRYQK